MEVGFCGFQTKICLNFKSQGTENFERFSQGTYECQNLRYETLAVADYEHVKIFKIAVMDIKLWMKEGLDLHTYHIRSSFKFNHPKAHSSFSRNIISNTAKLSVYSDCFNQCSTFKANRPIMNCIHLTQYLLSKPLVSFPV